MSNIYKEYFDTLKIYLTILKIDAERVITGCSEDEINILKNKNTVIPLAYEEYLRSIGKNFLFEFMDAENMSYEGLDYINEFANEVFQNNSLTLDKEYLVISERRNDYISLIYTDEKNPKVWIMSEYWDENDGENLSIRSDNFIDLINKFFKNSLLNQTATFHFVSTEIKDTEKYIKNKYHDWSKGLYEIKSLIDKNSTGNYLIYQLNEYFMEYYSVNEKNILDEIKSSKKIHFEAEKTDNSHINQILENKKKENLFLRILNIFK